MKLCPNCNAEDLVEVLDHRVEHTVGGVHLHADIPARRCNTCGHVVVHGGSYACFHIATAIVLCEFELDAPDALRFVRKTTEQSPSTIAAILGVTRDRVLAWERGQEMVDPRYPMLLRAIVDGLRRGQPPVFDATDPRNVALEIPRSGPWSRDSLPSVPSARC